MDNKSTTEVIHSAPARTGSAAPGPAATYTGSSANAAVAPISGAAWIERNENAPISNPSGCSSGNSGWGGSPPTDVSTAAFGSSSGDHGAPRSFSLVGGLVIDQYPEEKRKNEEPLMIRAPWNIRVIAATIIAVAAIALAATVSSFFLVLFIPAMLLISERGEM